MLQRKKQRQIQRKWPATFCVAQRRSEGASPPMQTLYFQIRRCLYAEMKIQRWRKTNTRTMTNNVLRITRMEASQSTQVQVLYFLDFAGQWQRQRQTQRKYENNDLRYTASHKKGERKPTQTHMHYASIVFSNQTVFLNCNYKYKDPRI